MIAPRFAEFGPPEVANASDRRAVKRAAKREQQEQRRLREAYLAVLKTASGRAMFWDLLERGEAFGSGLVRDPHERDFLAGQRHFAVTLLNDLAALDAGLFLTMQGEAQARRTRAAVERETAAARGTTGRDDAAAEGIAERAGDDESEDDET